MPLSHQKCEDVDKEEIVIAGQHGGTMNSGGADATLRVGVTLLPSIFFLKKKAYLHPVVVPVQQ